MKVNNLAGQSTLPDHALTKRISGFLDSDFVQKEGVITSRKRPLFNISIQPNREPNGGGMLLVEKHVSRVRNNVS